MSWRRRGLWTSSVVGAAVPNAVVRAHFTPAPRLCPCPAVCSRPPGCGLAIKVGKRVGVEGVKGLSGRADVGFPTSVSINLTCFPAPCSPKCTVVLCMDEPNSTIHPCVTCLVSNPVVQVIRTYCGITVLRKGYMSYREGHFSTGARHSKKSVSPCRCPYHHQSRASCW